MFKYLDLILRQALAQRLFLYGYYLVLILIIHLFIVSGAAFFHFLLDHRLGVIEDWIFDRGWDLVIITKVSALYIFSRYINIGGYSKGPIWSIIKEGLAFPPLALYSFMVAFLVIIFWLGDAQRMPYVWHGIGRVFISYLGVFIFYMCDILVLVMVTANYPLTYVQRNLSLLFFPILFVIVNKIVFMYEVNINGLVFLTIFLGIYMSRWVKNNWIIPGVFIFFAISPLSIFFGEDPIWGDSYSLWGFENNISWRDYLLIGGLGFFYLFFQKHNISEIRRYARLKLRRLFKSNL